MTIQPEGEDLRNAIKWISEMRQDEPDKSIGELIDEACVKFDLSPLDAGHLGRYLKSEAK